MLSLFCWVRPLRSTLAQWAVATRHEVRPFNGSLLILEHATRAAALMKPTPPATWKMKKRKEMRTLGVGTVVIANRYDITMVGKKHLCSVPSPIRRKGASLLYIMGPIQRDRWGAAGRFNNVPLFIVLSCQKASLVPWKQCVFCSEMWL